MATIYKKERTRERTKQCLSCFCHLGKIFLCYST